MTKALKFFDKYQLVSMLKKTKKKSGEASNITFQFESYTLELINKKNTDDKSE